jgi:hypothetical protein|nr:MAG TPA_asm: tail protein [Caudoviricetes sp.]
MIYTTGTIAINGNTVKGTGTNFSAPLSLIRVGCTLIAISNPIQIFTITEIKSGTELSVTPAASPAIAAGTKFSILLSDSISVDGLAQDVAETLRFYQEKEDEISSAIDGSNIGLGPEPRDCTDISGNPSSYVGFLRIKETTKGFPSVAAGESFLSGFICQRDTTPSYTGVFVGWSTRSLYTYTWIASSGANWTRHARKDEVDRLLQSAGSSKESQLWDGDKKNYIFVNNTGWGAYSTTGAIKLGIMYGGTGAGNAAEARNNLMVMHDAKSSLSSTQNLDDLKGDSAGFYHQYLSANAKPELNYPKQVAGSLLVQKTGAGDAKGCIQTYYVFNDVKTSYRRVFNGEGWSAWKKIVVTERVDEWGSETWIYNADNSMRMGLSASLWGCYSDTQKKWIPLAVAQGGTGATNAETARANLGVGSSNSPQFLNVSLKRATDVTTGWVAGGLLSSALVGTTGTERVYGAVYPETHLTEPDQLTMHLRTGGVSKYASLTANGEFIADSFKAKNAQQTRRNLNIPTIGGGELMTIEAPEGVEDGKYYPIIINANYYNAYLTGYQVDIVTASGAGSYPMNCNTFSGYIRTGGWSDRKDAGYGFYNRYTDKEIALHSICSSSKDKENLLFVFVEARAFPVKMRLPVGVTVQVPTAQVVYNSGKDTETIIPWGVSDPLGSYKNLQVMFDFRMGRCGFYSATTEGLHYICSGARVGLFSGITVGEEISMTMPKLTINGTIGSSKGYAAETGADWNTQQSGSLNNFKPIAGNVNAPESNVTYGGFHVGFSGTHATQFAGRNSSFYARSFEAGVDKGWHQLATLDTKNLWTGDNHFTVHYVFDSTHTRFMKHQCSASSTVNAKIVSWGDKSVPLYYEVIAADTNSSETSLKSLFMAKYLSDGSAQLQVGGSITCTTVTQTSDRDLKDNIQVIGDATEAIRKMNGYTYTLKENGLPYAGVIAQEVMEALPEAVGSFTHYGEALQGPTTDGNELREETRYLNVDYAAVTGLLVQVARETDNRVTELEEENASLRANIAAMDERIAKLEALVRQLTGSEE